MGFTLNGYLLLGALLISFVIAIFLFFLLISTKLRRVISVPLTQFLSVLVVIIGVVLAIISGRNEALGLIILLENLFLIPHYMGMRSQKVDKKKRRAEN